jgi:membrane protein DedA with SNARE-associated domain
MDESEPTGWLIDVIDALGESGIGFLIFLENIFPPIPSEAILPLGGFRAEQGEMNLVVVWVAATLGALAGALVLYGLGVVVGYDRLHELAGKRWFVVLSQKDLERGNRFFDHHGGKIVVLGRCVPLVRSVVSVPAGLARMNLATFCLLTVIGSGVWNAIFVGAGWVLGDNYERIEGWVAPFSYVVAAVGLVGIVVLIVRKQRRRRALAQAARLGAETADAATR